MSLLPRRWAVLGGSWSITASSVLATVGAATACSAGGNAARPGHELASGGTNPAGGVGGNGGHDAIDSPGGRGPTPGGSAGQGRGGDGGSAGTAPSGELCDGQGVPPSGALPATLISEVTVEGNDFHLFEGPVWINPALYFSDINTNQWHSAVRKFDPATLQTSDFLVAAGSTGLAVDASGELFSATTGLRELSRYDLATAAQSVVRSGMYNSPNDLAIAKDGTIYFSDPAQDGLTDVQQPQVFHMLKGDVDTVFAAELAKPNGVTLSPKEDFLYVCGGGNEGYFARLPLRAGVPGAPELLVEKLKVPDGMTKDCAGNIYLAVHEGPFVAVYDPEGQPLATISLGAAANGQSARPTNLAFGGVDHKTLFITAAYSLWQVELDIAGYPY